MAEEVLAVMAAQAALVVKVAIVLHRGVLSLMSALAVAASGRQV